MKKIFLILVVFVLISAGCKSAQQESTPTSQSTTLTAQQIFDKKSHCAGYKSQIEAELEKMYFENPKTGTQIYYSLDKIFYSPSRNSCLYTYSGMTLVKGKLTWQDFQLKDYLSNELLTSVMVVVGEDNLLDKQNTFDSIVKDYE